jgi:hypothetical protein
MQRVAFFLIWATFFLGSSGAGAVTLTVSFSGTVDTVPTALASAFSKDEAISGSFQIDSLTSDSNPDATIGLYLGPTNSSFQFGSYLATAPGGSSGDSVLVRNAGQDSFQFNGLCGGLCGATDVGEYFLTNMGLALHDSTATVFTSQALPTSLDIGDFDSAQVTLTFQHVTLPSQNVIGAITSVTLVPQPSTALLLAAGLAGLAAAGRRRSRQ